MNDHPVNEADIRENAGDDIDFAALAARFEREVGAALVRDERRTTCRSRRHALVDAGRGEADWLAGLRDTHHLEGIALFDHTPESMHREIGPWLLPLPEDERRVPVVAELASVAGSRHALSFIDSQLSAERLADHLRPWMSGVLDDGTEVLLRFYDPRVGPDMLAALPAAYPARFMAPLDHWLSWDERYARRLVEIVTPHESLNSSATRLPIVLDPGLREHFARLNTADVLLDAIREERDLDTDRLDRLPYGLQRAIAKHFMAVAERCGIRSWSDLHFWVGLGLCIHPDLADREEWQTLLRRCARENLRVGDEVVRLAEVDRQALEESPSPAFLAFAERLLAGLDDRAKRLAPESAPTANH